MVAYLNHDSVRSANEIVPARLPAYSRASSNPGRQRSAWAAGAARTTPAATTASTAAKRLMP